LKQFGNAIPGAASRVGAVATAGMAEVNSVFAKNTGFDAGALYNESYARRANQAESYGKELVTAQFTGFNTPDPKKPWQRDSYTYEQYVKADEGQYKLKQKVSGGGVVINIQNLNAISNDAGRAAKDIVSAATKGAAIPAAAY
jgi:hypothetical protein